MSTAVQRLGHVLGWMGTGLAAIFFIAAASIAVSSFWTIYKTNNLPIVYELKTPKGDVWEVITADGSGTPEQAADEMLIAEKGEPSPKGWLVYKQGSLPPGRQAVFEELKRRFGAKVKESTKRDAWDQVTFLGGISLVLAVISWLAGRALRYILSGSEKENRGGRS